MTPSLPPSISPIIWFMQFAGGLVLVVRDLEPHVGDLLGVLCRRISSAASRSFVKRFFSATASLLRVLIDSSRPRLRWAAVNVDVMKRLRGGLRW